MSLGRGAGFTARGPRAFTRAGMAASELGPGTVIGGRYRLERLLGQGGMGAVWAALDIEASRRCALKLMKDDASDPEARKRFLREGRAAAAVRHPSVVGILDVLDAEGVPPAPIEATISYWAIREPGAIVIGGACQSSLR